MITLQKWHKPDVIEDKHVPWNANALKSWGREQSPCLEAQVRKSQEMMILNEVPFPPLDKTFPLPHTGPTETVHLHPSGPDQQHMPMLKD